MASKLKVLVKDARVTKGPLCFHSLLGPLSDLCPKDPQNGLGDAKAHLEGHSGPWALIFTGAEYSGADKEALKSQVIGDPKLRGVSPALKPEHIIWPRNLYDLDCIMIIDRELRYNPFVEYADLIIYLTDEDFKAQNINGTKMMIDYSDEYKELIIVAETSNFQDFRLDGAGSHKLFKFDSRSQVVDSLHRAFGNWPNNIEALTSHLDNLELMTLNEGLLPPFAQSDQVIAYIKEMSPMIKERRLEAKLRAFKEYFEGHVITGPGLSAGKNLRLNHLKILLERPSSDFLKEDVEPLFEHLAPKFGNYDFDKFIKACILSMDVLGELTKVKNNIFGRLVHYCNFPDEFMNRLVIYLGHSCLDFTMLRELIKSPKFKAPMLNSNLDIPIKNSPRIYGPLTPVKLIRYTITIFKGNPYNGVPNYKAWNNVEAVLDLLSKSQLELFRLYVEDSRELRRLVALLDFDYDAFVNNFLRDLFPNGFNRPCRMHFIE